MEDIHGFEDGLLSDVHIAYEDIYITDINSRIKSIESDDSGKLLALVEYDGSISIWECKDEDWRRTAAWKYKPPRQLEYKSAKMGPNGPLSSNDSINVIARWCHSSGRYLGVASNVSNKVHLFGENTDPFLFDESDSPVVWHRKHTMLSAGNVTEMRFSPSHVELTLVTATKNGMVVVHMLQNKHNIKSWRAIHAISVFRNQQINSLSWNQNPVHELPILVASTDDMEARDGQQIAVFAINSPSVRPDSNMCFENVNQVTSVSFAPSNGLNDSLLEFQIPEHFSPSLISESDDCQDSLDTENDSIVGSANAISSVIKIDNSSNVSTPISMTAYINPEQNTSSTLSSDVIPNDFFRSDESSVDDINTVAYREEVSESDENNSTDEEEMEQEASNVRKALMWNVRQIAVFREPCAIKRIQWGRNPDNFVAHLIDGTIQGYKWSFGCIWSRSTVLNPNHLKVLECAEN